MADDEFEWRPRRTKSKSGVALAAFILAVLFRRRSIQLVLADREIVVAIERNGYRANGGRFAC